MAPITSVYFSLDPRIIFVILFQSALIVIDFLHKKILKISMLPGVLHIQLSVRTATRGVTYNFLEGLLPGVLHTTFCRGCFQGCYIQLSVGAASKGVTYFLWGLVSNYSLYRLNTKHRVTFRNLKYRP